MTVRFLTVTGVIAYSMFIWKDLKLRSVIGVDWCAVLFLNKYRCRDDWVYGSGAAEMTRLESWK